MNDRPVVFISYTWETKETPGHKEWVKKLADDLIAIYGIIVELDQYELTLGKPLINFMERSIEAADKVLIICTPTYKQKAINTEGGVGYEHSLITTELFRLQKDNNKFIPILRLGSKNSSIPGYLASLVYLSMVDDTQYLIALEELVREIWGHRKIQKPILGAKPDFTIISESPPLSINADSLKDQEDRQRIWDEYIQSRGYIGDIEKQIGNLLQYIMTTVWGLFIDGVLHIRIKPTFDQDDLSQRFVIFAEIGHYVMIDIYKEDWWEPFSKPIFIISYYRGSVLYMNDKVWIPRFLNEPINQQIEWLDFGFDVEKDLSITWKYRSANRKVILDEVKEQTIDWMLDKKKDPAYLKRLALYRERIANSQPAK